MSLIGTISVCVSDEMAPRLFCSIAARVAGNGPLLLDLWEAHATGHAQVSVPSIGALNNVVENEYSSTRKAEFRFPIETPVGIASVSIELLGMKYPRDSVCAGSILELWSDAYRMSARMDCINNLLTSSDLSFLAKFGLLDAITNHECMGDQILITAMEEAVKLDQCAGRAKVFSCLEWAQTAPSDYMSVIYGNAEMFMDDILRTSVGFSDDRIGALCSCGDATEGICSEVARSAAFRDQVRKICASQEVTCYWNDQGTGPLLTSRYERNLGSVFEQLAEAIQGFRGVNGQA